LKMGNYVNENDLRRALNQPIREDYYFDARNTGANQARFYNNGFGSERDFNDPDGLNHDPFTQGPKLKPLPEAVTSYPGSRSSTRMGDFSNKEREVWRKLSHEVPTKASGWVSFSLSESRFIRDYSDLYSAEKLAQTIEYFYRNNLTPWYDNTEDLERDFYQRLSDVTLDNGHVIESEDIQLYLELYGGPEKFADDNIDSWKGKKEARIVGAVAQRIDDIRVGKSHPIRELVKNNRPDEFVTQFMLDNGIELKPKDTFIGYKIDSDFNPDNLENGSLTTNSNWSRDIANFELLLERQGLEKPFKELNFDEVFFTSDGMTGAGRAVRRIGDEIKKADGLYVYRGLDGQDIIYSRHTGKLYYFARTGDEPTSRVKVWTGGEGQSTSTINSTDIRELTLGIGADDRVHEFDFFLPVKTQSTVLEIMKRRDEAFYPYELENQSQFNKIDSSDPTPAFTSKLNESFNNPSVENNIKERLRYLPLMNILAEEGEHTAIQLWLSEFSRGERQAKLSSLPLLGNMISPQDNPNVFYIPLAQNDSEQFDGLMVNWERGEVIPVPRDPALQIDLYKTRRFRRCFGEGISKQVRDEAEKAAINSNWYASASNPKNEYGRHIGNISVYNMINNFSAYTGSIYYLDEVIKRDEEMPPASRYQTLDQARTKGPKKECYGEVHKNGLKQRVRETVLQYVELTALGIIEPNPSDYQTALEHLARLYGMSKEEVLTQLAEDNGGRLTRISDTVNVVEEGVSIEKNLMSYDISQNLKANLESDFDYHVTSASEERTQRVIESLRVPLRIVSYGLAVGLGFAFPGVGAAVIGGMVTTFLTDTVLDIVQLGTEDNLEKRQELLEGIIGKCYISLGAELGGAVLGPAAAKLVKWMTKTVSSKILGESAEGISELIDNMDLRALQERIDIERGMSSRQVIKTRWGRIRTRTKAAKPEVRTRKAPITRDLTEEQQTELFENQLSHKFRTYSMFESIWSETVTPRDILKAATILGLTNELMLQVEKAFDPEISGHGLFQITKMLFVYSLAGATTEALSLKSADDLLDEAMTKLNIPQQKRLELLRKARIDKQKLLDDPQVKRARAAMDSTDPVESSVQESNGPVGRDNQDSNHYPEDNWNDEANRLMRLNKWLLESDFDIDNRELLDKWLEGDFDIDNRELVDFDPDISEATLAVGEDLTPKEMGSIPKRQRKDGNRMQEEQHPLADRAEV
ncbi:hypothetical protein, partial [Vibrio zhanjiangensis]|uniref:hypothetical protein n=1 Tax=Vibrio zhanjiangensis TaxID=1046128 RepID=UPI0024E16D87